MSNTDLSRPVRRPSLLLYFTEFIRAIFEAIRSWWFRRKAVERPPGDGHPVLVIPGFMTSDASTVPLRKFLRKNGYEAFGWKGGRNLGNVVEDQQLIRKRINELYERYQQPVSLIGWSLGGVYSRQVAKECPQQIRQLITLGSPFGGITEPNNASWIYRLLHWGKEIEELNAEWLAGLPPPAPVPTTAIYSKRDGIVNWRVCMEKEEDELHQNVELKGSHLGFGVNRTVLEVILNRLQYSVKNWQLL